MTNVETLLQKFNIISSDLTRPWGGFYVIDETQAQLFSDTFLRAWMFLPSPLAANWAPKFCSFRRSSASLGSTTTAVQKFGACWKGQ